MLLPSLKDFYSTLKKEDIYTTAHTFNNKYTTTHNNKYITTHTFNNKFENQNAYQVSSFFNIAFLVSCFFYIYFYTKSKQNYELFKHLFKSTCMTNLNNKQIIQTKVPAEFLTIIKKISTEFLDIRTKKCKREYKRERESLNFKNPTNIGLLEESTALNELSPDNLYLNENKNFFNTFLEKGKKNKFSKRENKKRNCHCNNRECSICTTYKLQQAEISCDKIFKMIKEIDNWFYTRTPMPIYGTIIEQFINISDKKVSTEKQKITKNIFKTKEKEKTAPENSNQKRSKVDIFKHLWKKLLKLPGMSENYDLLDYVFFNSILLEPWVKKKKQKEKEKNSKQFFTENYRRDSSKKDCNCNNDFNFKDCYQLYIPSEIENFFSSYNTKEQNRNGYQNNKKGVGANYITSKSDTSITPFITPESITCFTSSITSESEYVNSLKKVRNSNKSNWNKICSKVINNYNPIRPKVINKVINKDENTERNKSIKVFPDSLSLEERKSKRIFDLQYQIDKNLDNLAMSLQYNALSNNDPANPVLWNSFLNFCFYSKEDLKQKLDKNNIEEYDSKLEKYLSYYNISFISSPNNSANESDNQSIEGITIPYLSGIGCATSDRALNFTKQEFFSIFTKNREKEIQKLKKALNLVFLELDSTFFNSWSTYNSETTVQQFLKSNTNKKSDSDNTNKKSDFDFDKVLLDLLRKQLKNLNDSFENNKDRDEKHDKKS